MGRSDPPHECSGTRAEGPPAVEPPGVACEAAERGLHLGSGFTIGDWLARFWPDLHKQTVIDLGRFAVASREGVHRALADAVLAGRLSVARGARLPRALARIRRAIGQEEYSAGWNC